MSNDEFFDDLSRAIAEKANTLRVEKLEKSDWTVERLVNEHEITDAQARKILLSMVKKGMAREIWVKAQSGKRCKAWRPIEKKKG